VSPCFYPSPVGCPCSLFLSGCRLRGKMAQKPPPNLRHPAPYSAALEFPNSRSICIKFSCSCSIVSLGFWFHPQKSTNVFRSYQNSRCQENYLALNKGTWIRYGADWSLILNMNMQIQRILTVGNVAEYIYINLCEGSEIWRGLNIFKEVPKTILCKIRRSVLFMYYILYLFRITSVCFVKKT